MVAPDFETIRVEQHPALFVRRFAPSTLGEPRTIVIVHGTGEHSGRYEHFCRHLTDDGWTVLAGDLRGHGQSDGVPTHLDDFEHYLDDLDALWDHFQLDPQRTALYGHSLGGLIAARYLQRRPGRAAGLILSSPLLRFVQRVPLYKSTFGRLCLMVAPQTRFRTQVNSADITRNQAVLEERERDPLRNRTVTAGWYFRVLDALCEVWEHADKLDCPLLILQGDADRVVDPLAALAWFPQIGSRDKTLWMLPEHLHELLNEPGWERTSQRIREWLDWRVGSG